MKCYLVIADTYKGGYGCDFTIFGVFPTKEEAINYIMTYVPKEYKYDEDGDYWYGSGYEEYNFFEGYEPTKTFHYDPATGKPVYGRRAAEFPTKTIHISKEEYAEKFISEYNGEPIYIGGYKE